MKERTLKEKYQRELRYLNSKLSRPEQTRLQEEKNEQNAEDASHTFHPSFRQIIADLTEETKMYKAENEALKSRLKRKNIESIMKQSTNGDDIIKRRVTAPYKTNNDTEEKQPNEQMIQQRMTLPRLQPFQSDIDESQNGQLDTEFHHLSIQPEHEQLGNDLNACLDDIETELSISDKSKKMLIDKANNEQEIKYLQSMVDEHENEKVFIGLKIDELKKVITGKMNEANDKFREQETEQLFLRADMEELSALNKQLLAENKEMDRLPMPIMLAKLRVQNRALSTELEQSQERTNVSQEMRLLKLKKGFVSLSRLVAKLRSVHIVFRDDIEMKVSEIQKIIVNALREIKSKGMEFLSMFEREMSKELLVRTANEYGVCSTSSFEILQGVIQNIRIIEKTDRGSIHWSKALKVADNLNDVDDDVNGNGDELFVHFDV